MKLVTRQIDALRHMTDNCAKAALVVARVRTQEQMEADWEVQYLLIRCVEIIGEASKRMGPEFHARHPHVPWRLMAGMRNHMAHGYDEISMGILWKTVTLELPKLAVSLEEIRREGGLAANPGLEEQSREAS